MLVTTLDHAEKVRLRLYRRLDKAKRRHVAFDTETRAKLGFPKDDALVYDRSDVLIFSMCFMGESYSFPTSHFNQEFPLIDEWAEFFLRPIFEDPSVVKVAHNWTYDYNVAHKALRCPRIAPFWDTLIGGWKASEYVEKGLKARAPLYGRFLRETKSVSFGDLKELALYAEEDVVQTDEMYQMQRYGKIRRPSVIYAINASGGIESRENDLAVQGGIVKVPNEGCSVFDRHWLRYLEFPVLRAVVRAQRRGFPIDVPRLHAIRTKLNASMREHLKYLFRAAGENFNLNSTKQLAEICKKLGIHNPHKTKKGAPSFNKKALSKIAHTHPFLQRLTAYRSEEKLRAVYVGSEGFTGDYQKKKLDCGLEYFVSLTDCSIHTTINTVGAVTGRASSSGPNLQQIPSRQDTYGIKECFVGTPKPARYHILVRRFQDRLLIVLDYSQLEIRVMCLLCKDPKMESVLCDPKGDIHQTTSDEFNVSRDPEAKQLNFLLLYGGMEYMLSEQLTFSGVPTTPDQARVYRERHAQVYARVPEYRQELLDYHKANDHVVLFLKRRRHLPDINWDDKYSVHQAETTLSNNVVQGSGQDFLKAAIVRSDWQCINPDAILPQRMKLPKLHRAYLADKAKALEKHRRILRMSDSRWRLQVHDESIFTVRPEAAEECLNILADIMSWRHYFPAVSDYNVPLVAEGGVGDTWKAAKSKDRFLFHVKAGYTEWQKYK
jgi:DNA polymerase I-like protein with 3'-5' exonuclease and polymerase domains